MCGPTPSPLHNIGRKLSKLLFNPEQHTPAIIAERMLAGFGREDTNHAGGRFTAFRMQTVVRHTKWSSLKLKGLA